MRLSEAIRKAGPPRPLAVPNLGDLIKSADRVRQRWPDIHVTGTAQEREALAQKLKNRVERDDWDNARLSFVVAATAAVFDQERRDRPDLDRTREFLYAEASASTSATFLSGLLRTFLDSYVPNGAHTAALATALHEAAPQMSAAARSLLKEVPEILDSINGPGRLAARMLQMPDPYKELSRLGVRNPHGPGFMNHTHLSLTERIRPNLSERERIDWYIRWLRGKEDALIIGADRAIEALIHPWLHTHPGDALRTHLVETLIELYGDPRIRSGGAWAGVDKRHMAIIHRWLTREDMRFFTGVVDANQDSHMWEPRRDFWLELYDEDQIDAAWVALSPQAFAFARQNLMRQDAKNADTRFGFQRARQNTSLLIMQIGNKIMVDGCHSYRTHVFDQDDPMAPKLFQEGYDCDEIRRASYDRPSGASKPHNSIPYWSRWVRDMINADVPRSRSTKPYTRVSRPHSPRSPSHAETRFPTLTDRMIACGPGAAVAVLAYLEDPAEGKTRPLLSPKSKEGLAWVREGQGELPPRLRNALEHLLINLKKSGVDLNDLFRNPSTAKPKTRNEVKFVLWEPVEPKKLPVIDACSLTP
ncbi:MAG: hypothetical protein GDA53_03525 [Rhodobacteraceae bacterium]|nr:hypothetical protein [Paracoccaceae bacterium]